MYGVGHSNKNDGGDSARGFRREAGGSRRSHQDIDVPTYEFLRQSGQSFVAAMCPSWLELDILTFDPTKLTHAQTARFPKMLTFFGDKREEIAHSRQLGGLLSERRDRPGSCGTGKQSDELAPSH